MAGGSADAAAALLACDLLWRTGLSRDDLLELAAELGSDVPFALSGHTAVGSGRGHLLTPALSRGEFHWAFAVQDRGLSTADVYAAFDEITPSRAARPTPRTTCRSCRPCAPVTRARSARPCTTTSSSPRCPWTPASPSRSPSRRTPGRSACVVSGSGPTVAALGRSRQHALVLAAAFTASGVADRVLTAAGPVAGARVLSSTD